jgi:hypothetical protein
MLTLKHACHPRPSVFDSTQRDTVHDLLDLTENRLDPRQFFEENYATQGMKTLLDEAFKRLEGGAQAQGVFRLSQSMGGGKTHNLIALGLLAKHPEWRETVMKGFHKPHSSLGIVRVAAFSGRQNDVPYGIWGEIARQIGKEAEFAPYYAPLAAPGQEAWVNLLRGEPLVILLDELPPYFNNARTKTIGMGTLADLTTTALANLMIAVSSNKLDNVVLVLTDLSGTSYQEGQQFINQALQDANAEATRLSAPIDPVRMNTDEFYHILRTRLFTDLPNENSIQEVARAYGQALKQAKAMDITTASPEQFAADIESSYPFHPAIRDLYARFRENQGFQQTRALIRMMRIIVADLWGGKPDGDGRANTQYLIAAHDFDLMNPEMIGEIRQINSKLDNAVAHDIETVGGGAVAQRIDSETGTTNALDVTRLLFLASLSTSINPTLGLNRSELVAYLAAPGRDVARLNKEIVERLQTEAWYLHATRDGRLYFKDVVNINAKLDEYTRNMMRDIKEKELKAQLGKIFAPNALSVYHKLELLPALDEIKPTADSLTLVIFRPADSALQTIRTFYEQATLKNRICFLTGDANTYERVLQNAAALRACDAILVELRSENRSDSDPQMQEALSLRTKYESNLYMAVKSTFLLLYYPTRDGLNKLDMDFQYSEHKFDGEEQIRKALEKAYKYTQDVGPEGSFRQKVENKLWLSGQQEAPWSQIKANAAQDPSWNWHPMNALDQLKNILVQRDLWREAEGYVDKGPFPQPKTEVRVQVISRDEETGRVKLKVTPMHGDRVYMETGGSTPTQASRLLDSDTVEVDDMNVSFLAADSQKAHEPGDVYKWTNTVSIKYRFFDDNGLVRCELRAAPPVRVHYTTDGSNPVTNGGVYSTPFIVPKGAKFVLAAPADGKGKTETISIPDEPEKPSVNLEKPCSWSRKHHLSSTMETFNFLALCRKYDVWLAGTKVYIGSGRKWIEILSDEETAHEVDAVEKTIEAIRELYGLQRDSVSLDVSGLNFEMGLSLMDFIAELKTTLKHHEVKEIEPKK